MCIREVRNQRGVTLVELVLFIIIVSIALASVVGVFTLTTRNSADPLRRKQALMIAEGLLEEVELAQFTYCKPDSDKAGTANSVAECGPDAELFGPELGDSRPYDNVNDYGNNANVFMGGGGAVLDANLTSMGVNGYSATVSVQPAALNDIGGGSQADPNVLQITVTVTYDAGSSVRLDGFRTRYAPQVQ
jgi:MSHA pilin protein MshD